MALIYGKRVKILRAALIIDGDEVKKWQKGALDAVSDLLDIRLVLSCTNMHTEQHLAKHFLYYVLNLFTLRNYLTHRVKLESDGIRLIEFESVYDGSWQKIPDSISRELLGQA